MTRPTLLALALFALSSRFVAAQDASSSSCPCTLKGVVLNAVTGAPVPGALVQSSAISRPAVLTDAEGAFHFDNLPVGPFFLAASKPGFQPGELFHQSVFQIAPDIPPAVLKITPGGVITGRVVDDQGEPLEDFTVRLIRRAPSEGDLYLHSFNNEPYRTNDLGLFRVPDLNPGVYFVLVSPPFDRGVQSSSDTVPLMYPPLYYPGVLDVDSATAVKVTAGHEARADFVISAKPAIRLSGTVSGFSLGDRIAMTLTGSFQYSQHSGITIGPPLKLDHRTGVFQTGWLAQGSYYLSVSSVEPQPSNVNSQPAERLALLSLTASSSLSGIQLVLASPVMIPIELHGFSNPQDTNQLSIYSTAAGGSLRQAIQKRSLSSPHEYLPYSYEIGLFSGVNRLQINPFMAEPYYVESMTLGSANILGQDFTVDSSTARNSIDITFRMGAATLSGTVNSKDISRGALLCIFPPGPRTAPYFVIADLDGRFKRDHLAPGVYRIVAIDGLIDPDLRNQELVKKLSSAATEVTLAPEQSLSLALEISKLPD
jgi:Carboxypeptidase regulatory-like domain